MVLGLAARSSRIWTISSSVRGVARYPGLGISAPVLVRCHGLAKRVVQLNGLRNGQVQIREDRVATLVQRCLDHDLVHGNDNGRHVLSSDLVRTLGHSCTLLVVTCHGKWL